MDSSVKSELSEPRPVNFPLLSLGMLLTNVIIERPIEEIDIGESMSNAALSKAKESALSLVDDSFYASSNYMKAVQWCFENSSDYGTLKDPNLGRKFYDEVICRLEEDWRKLL